MIVYGQCVCVCVSGVRLGGHEREREREREREGAHFLATDPPQRIWSV